MVGAPDPDPQLLGAPWVVSDLWGELYIVDDVASLTFIKRRPEITEALAPFTKDIRVPWSSLGWNPWCLR